MLKCQDGPVTSPEGKFVTPSHCELFWLRPWLFPMTTRACVTADLSVELLPVIPAGDIGRAAPGTVADVVGPWNSVLSRPVFRAAGLAELSGSKLLLGRM